MQRGLYQMYNRQKSVERCSKGNGFKTLKKYSLDTNPDHVDHESRAHPSTSFTLQMIFGSCFQHVSISSHPHKTLISWLEDSILNMGPQMIQLSETNRNSATNQSTVILLSIHPNCFSATVGWNNIQLVVFWGPKGHLWQPPGAKFTDGRHLAGGWSWCAGGAGPNVRKRW